MRTTMRATIINETGAPAVLVSAEMPRAVRINSEVLVRVIAAGINPLDAKTRAGGGVSAAITGFPAVLGHDFSGIVVEAAYDSHPLRVGTEVFGMTSAPRGGGSYAEYVAVSTLGVTRKPPGLSHIDAAGVPVAALTAWGMVVDVARAHEGQRMLIHAASGGVGHFAVQFAAYFGVHVIATGSARNLEWLRELGAREVIDYTATDFETSVSDVDCVIDLVGNVHDNTGTRSLGVLRRDGLLIHAPTGSWPGLLADAAEAGVRATTFTVAPDGSELAIIARLIASGDIRVHVDRVFDLSRACEAHEALETGHTRGKIVLRVSEE
ncbi:MAG: NADP-dependent oxidoreductase [Burkholderiaceae bacterium]|nr:NADP-dependent oxidoreductase [Microbacteriaceae bacterium]